MKRVDVKLSTGVQMLNQMFPVADKPRFTTEPVDVNDEEGNTVDLRCAVDGNPSPEIIWTHKDSDKVRINRY